MESYTTFFGGAFVPSTPAVNSAKTISTTLIQIVFNQSMSVTTAGWSFKKNGGALALTSVSGSGNTWVFLVAATADGDTITWSYDDTTGNTVSTITALELPSATDQAVDNTYDALATDYYAKALSLGVTVIEPLYTNIRNFTALVVRPQIATIGCIYVDAMAYTEYSEADAKILVTIDIADSTKTATLRNDYVGALTRGKGWTGSDNTLKFGVLPDFNPSTSPIWGQNDAQFWVLFLEGETLSNHHDISSFDAGFTNPNAFIRSNYNFGEVQLINNTGVLGAYGDTQTFKGQSVTWWGSIRSGAALTNEYMNNALCAVNTDASTAMVNAKIARFGAYSTSGWLDGFYSERPQGAFFTGSSAMDGIALWKGINTYLLQSAGLSSFLNKNIFVIGDSIFSNHLYGRKGRCAKVTIENLDSNWTSTNMCIASIPETAADVNTAFTTAFAPYYTTYWNSNVLFLTVGAYDIAEGSSTGAQLYNLIVSICTKAKTAGWQQIFISEPINRKAGLMVSQATYDAEVAAYNALMLADFDVATGITRYTVPSSITYATGYIALNDDSRFQDANDTTYFQADKINLTDTGNDIVADEYWTPIIRTYFPIVETITAVDATTIEVTFASNMTVTTAGWSFKLNGSPLTLNSVSGSGTTWSFDVDPMANGDTILFSYSQSGVTVSAITSNELKAYTDSAVTNSIPSAGATLVQAVASNPFSGTGSLAFTSNNTAGNLLVAYYMGTIGAFANTVTDTQGNANWTLGAKSNQGFGNDIEIWYCWNCAAGANTVNGTGIGANVNLYIEEWSGVKVSADPLLDTGIVDGSASPLQVSLNPTSAALILMGWYNGGTDDYTGLVSGLTLGYHETVGNYMAVANNPSASTGAQNVGITTGGDASNVLGATALELL